MTTDQLADHVEEPPRSEPARTRSNRLASMIIALACVVVAGIGVHITDNISPDVVRTVNVNQPARLDGAIITVADVRAGTSVTTGSDDHFSSKGMILAITVRLEAPGQQSLIGGLSGGITLYAGDRTYAAFGPNTSLSADAGFATTGDLLFEVDPRHIDGAYLELYRAEIFYSVPQKLHIRLGITRRNAAQWADAAKGRSLNSGDSTSEPLS